MIGAMAQRFATVFVLAILLASMAAPTTASPVSAKPTCQYKPATIVGTAKGEVIRGTPGRDVIVARGGHDSEPRRSANWRTASGEKSRPSCRNSSTSSGCRSGWYARNSCPAVSSHDSPPKS